MSNDSTCTVNANQGISFFGVLFIVLLILKLGVADTVVVGWSWWWVTAPLWGPAALVLGIVFVAICSMVTFSLVMLCIDCITSYRTKAKARKDKKIKE